MFGRFNNNFLTIFELITIICTSNFLHCLDKVKTKKSREHLKTISSKYQCTYVVHTTVSIIVITLLLL